MDDLFTMLLFPSNIWKKIQISRDFTEIFKIHELHAVREIVKIF